MIRPIQRADGIKFQLYGRRDGKKVYLGTFDSEREAKDALEEHRVTQRKIERGELPPESDPRRSLGAALDAWLVAIERQRSHDEYQARMRLYVREPSDERVTPLGALALSKLTTARVERLRDELASTGLAPRTVNGAIATLSAACTWFRRKHWITTNPCQDVRALESLPRAYNWIQSREGITALLAACTDNIRSLVAVLVGTGLRIDEALHLRWPDVDLEHRTIAVQRGRRGAPKSGRMRHVPIFDSVLGVLREMKLARGEGATGLLWPGARRGVDGLLPRDHSSVLRPFKRALKRAGLLPALRIHDLRHTFASHYLIDGGDIFKLSRILGHSSVVITERTYAHLRCDAHAADYGRVSFAMPRVGASADVISFSQSA